MNAAAAFPVSDESGVAGPRRVVLWLAEQLGFSEERAGRAALVVSELGTNLAKHARGGEILLRPLCSGAGDREGLEIVSVDAGPGIPDFGRSRRDGFSTSGTLGHGLGAIERQSDFLDLYSYRGGTAIVARLWRDDSARVSRNEPRYDVGAVQVAKTGEDVCGDAWSYRLRDGRLAILVADGLGHGLHAHEAAELAVRTFAQHYEKPPAQVIESVHAGLRPTRGAAAAMLALDLHRGTATYAGLGNIAGAILPPAGGRHHLVSHNGTAGHTAARIQEFAYPAIGGSTIVLTSDGLGTHWDLSSYPTLRTRSASVIAAILYRDFSRRRDDVTVVVAKESQPLAEKL